MFGYSTKAEAVQPRIYAMALEASERGKDLDGVHFYLCPVCGHIGLGMAPDSCPMCSAPKERFIRR